MEEQFSYLNVQIEKNRKGTGSNYIYIEFSLYDEEYLKLIDQYDFVIKYNEFHPDHEIGFYFEDVRTANLIAKEIKSMVCDRTKGRESSTDRVSYFGMLLSALHQFIY